MGVGVDVDAGLGADGLAWARASRGALPQLLLPATRAGNRACGSCRRCVCLPRAARPCLSPFRPPPPLSLKEKPMERSPLGRIEEKNKAEPTAGPAPWTRPGQPGLLWTARLPVALRGPLRGPSPSTQALGGDAFPRSPRGRPGTGRGAAFARPAAPGNGVRERGRLAGRGAGTDRRLGRPGPPAGEPRPARSLLLRRPAVEGAGVGLGVPRPPGCERNVRRAASPWPGPGLCARRSGLETRSGPRLRPRWGASEGQRPRLPRPLPLGLGENIFLKMNEPQGKRRTRHRPPGRPGRPGPGPPARGPEQPARGRRGGAGAGPSGEGPSPPRPVPSQLSISTDTAAARSRASPQKQLPGGRCA